MARSPRSTPSLRTRLRTSAATAAVATALIASLGCGSSSDRSDAKSATDALADIAVSPLNGAPALRLGVPADQPIVVNVWASWCVPCRKEMPAFDAVSQRYRGKVRFVGINLGDDETTAQDFIDQTGVTFDQYLDPDSTVQTAFSVTGMPATALIRADGTVAETHNGALDESELETLLADELDVANPSAGS